MKRFSQRIGKRELKTQIQIDNIDTDLRNSLWNVLTIFIFDEIHGYNKVYSSPFDEFFCDVWIRFLKEPIDEMPDSTDSLTRHFRARFFQWSYLDVYDFIDFITQDPEIPIDLEEFVKTVNSVLKTELSGYRFVDFQLVPIIDESQIIEVEKAIENSGTNGLIGANLHLSSALEKLSHRKNPDYRNSIKESISAVESVCQFITKDEKAELGKALRKIQNHIDIHPALLGGFKKIYGYVSDGDGIRHAILDEPNIDQEDAIYFLVSCSAFINYLIRKAQKAKIFD